MSFLRRALFDGYYSLTGRGQVLADVEHFNRLHRAPRAELDALTRNQLSTLLNHAAKTVPYYRDLIGSKNISPENALSVLAEMPPLTKAIIRQQGQKLISEQPGRKPNWNTSGGSTGEPVRLMQDKDFSHKHRAVEIMYLEWAGHRRGDPHVLIWGVPMATVGDGITRHERMFRFVCNQTYLNCYKLTDDLIDEWINVINEKKPALIEAYVDAIHEVSKRILKTGAKVHAPRGIIVSAGVLTEEARKNISAAFKAPLFNRYGSREVANVACACDLNREMHLNEPWCYFEIVDEQGQPCGEGEEGNVLITVYANKTMPLIRYRIEDRAIWGGSDVCACGRTTKRLKTVVGRASDYLIAADGTRINGTALTTLLYAVRGIERFQYRQRKDGSVELAAIPVDRNTGPALRESLQKPAADLAKMLKGHDVKVNIVEQIAPSNSGKYRYIINEMAGQSAPKEIVAAGK